MGSGYRGEVREVSRAGRVEDITSADVFLKETGESMRERERSCAVDGLLFASAGSPCQQNNVNVSHRHMRIRHRPGAQAKHM